MTIIDKKSNEKKNPVINLLNGCSVAKKFSHALEKIMALIPLYFEYDFVTSSLFCHYSNYVFVLLSQPNDNDLLSFTALYIALQRRNNNKITFQSPNFKLKYMSYALCRWHLFMWH